MGKRKSIHLIRNSASSNLKQMHTHTHTHTHTHAHTHTREIKKKKTLERTTIKEEITLPTTNWACYQFLNEQ